MQIAEDLQLSVGHICLQWLCTRGEVLASGASLRMGSSAPA
jgi:hypothetical protein